MTPPKDKLLAFSYWLFRKLDFLDERDRLVMVRSWRPYWDGRYVCWPSYLVDRPGQRAFVSPCWDRVRLKLLWRKALRSRSQTTEPGEG